MFCRRIASFLTIFLSTAVLTAQGPTATSPLPQAQGPSAALVNPGFAAKLRAVQFDVVAGRIVGSSIHVGSNVPPITTGEGGRSERLSIDLNNPAPTIRYELVDKKTNLKLDVSEGEKILIRYVQHEGVGSKTIEFNQQPHEDLTLTIEDAGGKRTIQGTTLWHLLLVEPATTKQTLAPMLEILRPDWKLSMLAGAIEEALCLSARLKRTVDRSQWPAWVAELANPRYVVRRDAELKLLEAGREALPFLMSLDRSTLDAEQWRRVRNAIDSLDAQQGDSLEKTVILLSSDPSIWISMLDRDDLSKRQLAAEQLKSIRGGPIDFDPAADAAFRAKQLNTLREQLAPRVKSDRN